MSYELSTLLRSCRIGNRTAKDVLRCLCDHADDDGANCFPSRERIMEETELTKNYIAPALSFLEAEGWIFVRKHQKNNQNFYQINVEKLEAGATKSASISDSSPQTGMSLNRDDSSPQTGTTVVPKRGKSSPQTGTRLYQDSINTLNTSNTSITRSQPKKTIPDCPQKKLIDLYHEILPMLPSVRCMSPAREQAIRSRWQFVCQDKGFKTQEEGLNWFSEYFAFVGRSKFLTGQTQPRADGRVFRADLEWIMKANNFAKIIDWRYHNER